jgi:hypothetical protein
MTDMLDFVVRAMRNREEKLERLTPLQLVNCRALSIMPCAPASRS